MATSEALPLKFYRRDTTLVARELLGKKLFREKDGVLTGGIIIETEAYLGIKDRACHTFGGRSTERVAAMYKDGGHAYVYLIYGLHSCLNAVTRTEKEPEAVLIRAIWPTDGVNEMIRRRGGVPLKNLASGPGKLCQALGITRADNGLLLNQTPLWVSEGVPFRKLKNKIIAGPRVGVEYAGEAAAWPLRFRVTSQDLDLPEVQFDSQKSLSSSRSKARALNSKNEHQALPRKTRPVRRRRS